MVIIVFISLKVYLTLVIEILSLFLRIFIKDMCVVALASAIVDLLSSHYL